MSALEPLRLNAEHLQILHAFLPSGLTPAQIDKVLQAAARMGARVWIDAAAAEYERRQIIEEFVESTLCERFDRDRKEMALTLWLVLRKVGPVTITEAELVDVKPADDVSSQLVVERDPVTLAMTIRIGDQ